MPAPVTAAVATRRPPLAVVVAVTAVHSPVAGSSRYSSGLPLPRPRSSGMSSVAPGASIGTSSLRRAIQLRRLRNDVAFRVLRGNVGTRLRRVEEGTLGAAVLALAGMKRLGLDALGHLDQQRVHGKFSFLHFLPPK